MKRVKIRKNVLLFFLAPLAPVFEMLSQTCFFGHVDNSNPGLASVETRRGYKFFSGIWDVLCTLGHLTVFARLSCTSQQRESFLTLKARSAADRHPHIEKTCRSQVLRLSLPRATLDLKQASAASCWP